MGKRRIATIYLLLALLSLVVVHEKASAGEELVLSPDGYGSVRFGERLADIEKKTGGKTKPSRPSGRQEPLDSGCDFVVFQQYPGIHFMVEDGIVTRGDALTANVQNSRGVVMGTPMVEVLRRNPTAVVEPHKYDPTGHYIIFRSPDGKSALVFEEGDGKVTDVRGGKEPSVEYVEDCL